MPDIDSRCGLKCTGCGWKESQGCGGCIETQGHPFHGECPVATCCQGKGLTHCGQCDMLPCDQLYAYSYLDPEHGDHPQGARVMTLRRWAAEAGMQRWENVLLTDSGFFSPLNMSRPFTAIIDRFSKMLGKSFEDAKVLFIPTAALHGGDNQDEAVHVAEVMKAELFCLGILPENLTVHDIDGTLTEDEAMAFDVIFFTGGSDGYLLRRIKQTGFDKIIKKMVYANKVYVGMSAGSTIATPNKSGCFGDPYCEETSGLCLIHAYIDAHCDLKSDMQQKDLPLPHIMLRFHQALAVSWEGYELVEAPGARFDGDLPEHPVMGVNVFNLSELVPKE